MKKKIIYTIGTVLLLLGGCAIERPFSKLDDETLINWGIKGSFEKGVVVLPFDVGRYNKRWSTYSAKRMKEYLLEYDAFKRVVFRDKPVSSIPFVLKGNIDYMWYGGSYTPSMVSITIRIISVQDGRTRYLKRMSMSYERRGFKISGPSKLYLSSPIPEQLLDGLLMHVAKDIAKETNLPVK